MDIVTRLRWQVPSNALLQCRSFLPRNYLIAMMRRDQVPSRRVI